MNRTPRPSPFSFFLSLPILLSTFSLAETSVVSSSNALEEALRRARPGDVIRLKSGTYRERVFAENVGGEEGRPITIRGDDPENPPVFEGLSTGLHLSKVRHVTLRDLFVKGATGNGINIDDGGRIGEPSHHVLLENLVIEETGPTGNRDGLKLSGVDQFVVRGCRIKGWGGSGIDMVGCHHGLVESCRFEGMSGFSQSNAVQMKGGTSDILVQGNHFKDVGQRGVNIGGSTGLEFFRPAVSDHEATRIEVAGNRFEGSVAPVNWVTTQGGWVHHNTIIHPEKWVARILQENTDARFKPSGGGLFEKNVVITDERVRVFVNVGGNTAPESFVFRDNAWYNESPRRPALPVEESGGSHAQIDDSFDLERVLQEQAEAGRGAGAYELKKPDWLASRETENLDTNDSIVFQCNFEADDWYREWGLNAAPERVDTVGHDPERRFEAQGGKALRIKVEKGGHYGTSMEFAFKKRIGSEPEEIYFRYLLRLADDWHPERGGKLPGFGGTYGRAGWGGRPANGRDGWSARGLFSGQDEGKTPIGYYCYHADMKGKYGAHWEWDRDGWGRLENNRWHAIEQYVKLNTPGENDGILRGWVDGKPAFEKTDVRMRDVDSLKVEAVWLNVYYGGSWTAPQDYHLYIDDVVISRERVGEGSF